jgi:hypothetical protein
MPVAVCLECGRDYYIPAGHEEEPRCERCGCLLAWAKALEEEHRRSMRESAEPGEEEAGEDGPPE